MGKMVSMVVSSDKVYWSTETNCHEEIIIANNLSDIPAGHGCPTLLRVEVFPDDNDWAKPFKEWSIHTDQRELPEWYDPNDVKERVMRALEQWYECCVIQPDQYISSLTGNQYRICLGSVDCMTDVSLQVITGKASIGTITGSSWINLVSNTARIIQLSGQTYIVSMNKSSQISVAGGESCVDTMYDDATVSHLSKDARIGTMYDRSRVVFAFGLIRHMTDYTSVGWLGETGTVKRKSRFAYVNPRG